MAEQKKLTAEEWVKRRDVVRKAKRQTDIENLARKIFIHSHEKWKDEHEMTERQSASDAFLISERFIDYRDEWRKAREQ